MTIRFLTAAIMLTATCAAYADVVPATSTSTDTNFLTSWKTGDGTDVAGSGVLNNSSLIGGVAYGSGDATQALFDKASSSVDQNGAVQLTYAKGIQGTYVLGTSNNILAAILGNGVSVVGSGSGVTVRQAQQIGARSDASTAGSTSGSQSGTASVSVGTQLAASTGGTSTGGTTSTGSTSTGTTSTGGTATDSALLNASTPVQSTTTTTQTSTQLAAVLPAAAADVPEPSSIALLAAGLFGVVGVRRRAK